VLCSTLHSISLCLSSLSHSLTCFHSLTWYIGCIKSGFVYWLMASLHKKYYLFIFLCLSFY
jgi:hypothetical protein